MNVTMDSTIIKLSVHACNFVLKVLDGEEPGARFWPKLMSKFQYIYLPSCITSIPIPLCTIVTQLSIP